MGKPFLGRGWKFPIQVDPSTGKIRMSEYEEDIEEAVRIILGTSKGERVYRSQFGCSLNDYVFSSMHSHTFLRIEEEIQEALMIWEPRIHQIAVKVEPDTQIQGKLNIHVHYVVRRNNSMFNKVYPFYLTEGG